MAHASAIRPSIRLWPGVVVVTVQWFLWLLPLAVPDTTILLISVGASFLGGLAVAIWWVFFSRAPVAERWGALLLMVAALVATAPLVDESIATAMMGSMLPMYGIPVMSLAFVAWAVVTRDRPPVTRRATMVATILLASGIWIVLRTDGMTGEARHDFNWRWAETAEERLLAEADDEPSLSAVETARLRPEGEAEWPGFRGPARDGVVPGVRVATDWTTSPPVELWRRPVGPGISSFAVHGDVFYTQEQRGEDEVVSAYRLQTGEPLWRHADPVRFWDSHAGAGPRATPTLSHGRVYTFGGTGVLNVLDADEGTVVWSRNAATDTETPLPGWGFASSPLVVDETVLVAVEGTLAAYDAQTGHPRWVGPNLGAGYSSPHLVTLHGVTQVLLTGATGILAVSPGDGAILWEHDWPVSARILQPALTANGDLLVSADGMFGTRRIRVSHDATGWTTAEVWTSNRLKAYYSDFVVHEGHAYGFDGSILACIDVEDGTRQWKGGRYGQGQLILLPDQNLLLITSEQGELVLVSATPDGFTEVARAPALEDKTWNHPVLVGNTLLVRNHVEMAAFRLAPAID